MTATKTPQHLEALESANRVRLFRAELKRDVAAGRITVAAVIIATPADAENLTLFELLQARRRWGRKRALKFLNAHAIGETKTLGSLTDRQRMALARALP